MIRLLLLEREYQAFDDRLERGRLEVLGVGLFESKKVGFVVLMDRFKNAVWPTFILFECGVWNLRDYHGLQGECGRSSSGEL